MAKYQYTVKGVDYEVEIQDIEGNIANVTVNGIPFEVEMKQPVKAGKQKVKLGGTANEGASSSSSAPQSAKASADLQSAASSGQTGNAGDAGKAATGKPVVAPLPGTINEIKVKVGDKVNAGDTVVILEAMKMQNNIEAETSGTITDINVNKGDAVMEGDTLVTIK
ncbi:biotin/lipoyl-binding protein [Prevotella copri]|uniref:Biotin carboxyl carrier protein of acetyl-CoA carboxylase n=1 Tax=Segatella copri TaxID=165179 RepID=A0AA90ZMI2_9BACT|nr:biotin/lipoyl-containing protein [Segatella copri]MQN13820.1 biotin/lipoyl-binding protein [Segatella copri]